MSQATIELIVRRTIRAPAERVFAAWTTPEQLVRWWGPSEMSCPEAAVDLRVGGRYRLANRDTAGNTVWISGTFVSIERPRELVYTWAIEPSSDEETVTVRFIERGAETEVVVVHQKITSPRARDEHERGWLGCLDGLVALLEAPASTA